LFAQVGDSGIAGGNMRKPDKCMHKRESPRMIELQPRDPFAAGQAGRFGEFSQLAAVGEGVEDVLLNGEITVGDGRHRPTQLS
jgi:hypothetical protein